MSEIVREIVLDTESTGLSPEAGDRVVEIGCVELINHIPTGATYQQYINPERSMPAEAERVHGLSASFLEDFPTFRHIADDFMAFIGDSPLVIHNAAFDMKFLNAEFARLERPRLPHAITDTLLMARKKFPGSPASLDALCRRFKIDTAHRTKHGALLDAEILATVYLELLGGRQQSLFAALSSTAEEGLQSQEVIYPRHALEPRVFALHEDEKSAHTTFINGKIKNALWLK